MDSEELYTQHLSKYALRSPLMKNSLKKTKTRSNSEYNSVRKVRTLETSNSYPGNNCHSSGGMGGAGSSEENQTCSSPHSSQDISDEDEEFQSLDELVNQHLKLTSASNSLDHQQEESYQMEEFGVATTNETATTTTQQLSNGGSVYSYNNSRRGESSSLKTHRRQWFEKKRHTFAASSRSSAGSMNGTGSLTSSQDSGVFSTPLSALGSTDDGTDGGNTNGCFKFSTSDDKPSLASAINKNLVKLEKLTAEFHFLNNDLSLIVKEEHRLIGLGEDGEVEEFSAFMQELGYLNMTAQSDIQRAYLAYMEYIATATELKEAIEKEEADMLERACKLHMEDQLFSKVPPQAIAKMRGEIEVSSPPLQTSF